MGGRHRTGRARRAGWFVAAAFLLVVVLIASATALVVNRRSVDPGSRTDPEAGVSMRTYPVPLPTASGSQRARHLRGLDTAPPAPTRSVGSRKPAAPATHAPSHSARQRRTPTRRCYVVRYNGHKYRYCLTRSPRP